MSDLKEFNDTVRYFAENNSPNIIENEGEGHAALLMSAIFDYSTKLKMLSGSLSRQLTEKDTYFSSLVKFIDRHDSELKLLLEEMPEEAERSKSLNYILDNIGKNVIVKIISDHSSLEALKEKNNGNKVHFSLGDEKIYRLEYSPEEYKADASFNRPKENSMLLNIFDDLFEKSTPFL